MKKLLIPLVFILIVSLLASCVTILSTDSTITLDNKENWQVDYVLLFEGESFKEYAQQVTDGINALSEEYQTTGKTIKFQQLPAKNGNIPYEITITGKGIASLNDTLGVSDAFTKMTVDGKEYYNFSMDGSAMASGGLSLGTAMEFKFTITGMRVEETNGKNNSPTSVTWTDPYQIMTATFDPAGAVGGAFKWWIIPIVLVGLAVVTLVVLLLTGVFKMKPAQPYGAIPGNVPQYAPRAPVVQTPPSAQLPVPGESPQSIPPPAPPASEISPPPPPTAGVPPPLPR